MKMGTTKMKRMKTLKQVSIEIISIVCNVIKAVSCIFHSSGHRSSLGNALACRALDQAIEPTSWACFIHISPHFPVVSHSQFSLWDTKKWPRTRPFCSYHWKYLHKWHKYCRFRNQWWGRARKCAWRGCCKHWNRYWDFIHILLRLQCYVCSFEKLWNTYILN